MSARTDRVVQLRREYDADPQGFQKAKRWIDAENALTEEEYAEYMGDYFDTAPTEQATPDTEQGVSL